MPATHRFERISVEKGANVEESTVELHFAGPDGAILSLTLPGNSAMDMFARLHGVADALGVAVRKRGS